MGVDCNIYLNAGNATAENVARVIAILAGNETTVKPLLGTCHWSTEVSGYKFKGSEHTPTIADLSFDHHVGEHTGYDGPDANVQHSVFIHLESGVRNRKCMMPRATAFWLAMGRRLVRFFGGELFYQDCEKSWGDVPDYKSRARFSQIGEDDETFQKIQNAMMRLKPITRKEMAEMEEFAAYKYEGDYLEEEAPGVENQILRFIFILTSVFFYAILFYHNEESDKTMIVHLKSNGNPVHGQDPDRPVYGVPNEDIEVANLNEASDIVVKWIKENDLGFSNVASIKVTDNGEEVGMISGNGRVWTPEEHAELMDSIS